MKNFVQRSETIRAKAPYDRLSGQGAKIGSTLFGIAAIDVLNTIVADWKTEGVFDIAKASGAWTEGTAVYWDNSAKVATLTVTGNMRIGIAVLGPNDAMAQSGDATGRVRLDGTGAMRMMTGTVTLDGSNPTTAATGLSTIVTAGVSLKATAAPGDDPSWLSHNYSGADGNLDIYAWKNTGGTDPTLVASTNNSATIDWWAIGT